MKSKIEMKKIVLDSLKKIILEKKHNIKKEGSTLTVTTYNGDKLYIDMIISNDNNYYIAVVETKEIIEKYSITKDEYNNIIEMYNSTINNDK